MSIPNFIIKPNGVTSKAFLDKGIVNFHEATAYVKQLPYKRISEKSKLHLVLEEQCGTCSSKHALLKKLAEENDFDDIGLTIGIYKMSHKNTPGVGDTIPKHLAYIPEAHTYLVYRQCKLDFTREGGVPLENADILEEISINADDIAEKKENIHKDFLLKWCTQNDLDFNKIWRIREACIAALSS